jgi:hypothetical protein
MMQAAFSYVIGLLFIINSVNTQLDVLEWVDMIVGVYFVIMGSIIGWMSARE